MCYGSMMTEGCGEASKEDTSDLWAESDHTFLTNPRVSICFGHQCATPYAKSASSCDAVRARCGLFPGKSLTTMHLPEQKQQV